MSEKISEYATSVTALASGDLMDVSKLISTSPDVYQSQKLNYSLFLTELNADLTINNLGNSDLTSTTNARIFALNGTTSSNYLSFTDGTNTILKIKGDGYVGIGINSASAALNVYHASDAIVAKFQRGTSSNSVIQILNSADSTYFGLSATGSDNGFSVGTSSDLTGNAILRVLSADGRLIQGLSNSVIADARLWNNSVNLYTDGTSLKARYKNASGTASDLTIGSNLGTADLTSTQNTRQFILNGTAATNYLEITNGTDRVIKFRGDKQVLFGDDTNYLKIDTYANSSFAILQYLKAGSTIAYNCYDSTGAEIFRFSQSGEIYAVRPAGISSHMNYNYFINFWASGTNSSIGFVQTNGSADTVYIGNDGGHGYVAIKNSTATTKTWLAGNGTSYFLNDLAVGVNSASARLHTKGPGSTSATTTALFQNSSAVTSLKVRDDNYVIQRAINSAINSGDLGNNEMSFYIDEAGNTLTVKVKYSSGTVKTGTVALV